MSNEEKLLFDEFLVHDKEIFGISFKFWSMNIRLYCQCWTEEYCSEERQAEGLLCSWYTVCQRVQSSFLSKIDGIVNCKKKWIIKNKSIKEAQESTKITQCLMACWQVKNYLSNMSYLICLNFFWLYYFIKTKSKLNT